MRASDIGSILSSRRSRPLPLGAGRPEARAGRVPATQVRARKIRATPYVPRSGVNIHRASGAATEIAVEADVAGRVRPSSVHRIFGRTEPCQPLRASRARVEAVAVRQPLPSVEGRSRNADGVGNRSCGQPSALAWRQRLRGRVSYLSERGHRRTNGRISGRRVSGSRASNRRQSAIRLRNHVI